MRVFLPSCEVSARRRAAASRAGRSSLWSGGVEAARARAPDAPATHPCRVLLAAEARVQGHGPAAVHVDGGPSGLELGLLGEAARRQSNVGEQAAVAVDPVLARGREEPHAGAPRRERLHVSARLRTAAFHGRAGAVRLGRVDPEQAHRARVAVDRHAERVAVDHALDPRAAAIGPAAGGERHGEGGQRRQQESEQSTPHYVSLKCPRPRSAPLCQASAPMKDILEDLMDAARGRADYADVRHVHTRHESIATRNGAVDEVEGAESEGVGVRVRSGGAWGFAATRELTRRGVEAALERALSVAAAQPRAPQTPLAPEPPARGSWRSEARIDPFTVPLEHKLAKLLEVDASMRGDARIAITTARMTNLKESSIFASTEGALCDQVTVAAGGSMQAVAVSGDDVQVRSYPASHTGDVRQLSYEHVESLDLAESGPRVAEEAIALLSAPSCEPGRTTLVLGGQQVALQVHESVGHAVELDRVLGMEASYAGTSFVTVADRGKLRYGSELMSVTADATSPSGLGTYGWDDEGVAARSEPIVTDGVLAGFLSSRETAAAIGLDHSAGCMRAEGFARQPIVRMSNVNLAPGDAGTLDDLIASTERGIYLETNRSWSIDSRRLQFQFATEAGWEIVDGERRGLVRNASYSGITPEFWRSLDAICSPSEWRLWGLTNCGKGEPGQAMRVSHGAAPARFRDVQVGVA